MPSLIEALKDTNPNVRNIAADALCVEVYLSKSLPLINAFINDDHELAITLPFNLETLEKLEKPELLLKLLQHKNKYVRWEALALLKRSRIYAHTIGAITLMLNDEYDKIRILAVFSLREMANPEAIEPLVQLLTREEISLIRFEAKQTLVKFGEQAVEPLAKLLKHHSEQARKDAARSLGQIGGNSAIDFLIEALNDTNHLVRATVISSLSEIGDKRTTPPLIKLLQTGDNRERANAAEALGKLKDSEAVQPLIMALKDGNSSVRGAAAKALGSIKSILAVEPLIAILEDENSWVRGDAALALGYIGDSYAVKFISKHYRDRHPVIRWCVATALGDLGESASLPILEWMYKHDKGGYWGDYIVYVAAGIAIAKIKIGKTPTFEKLIAGLKHEDNLVREYAAFELEYLKDIRAIPFLEDIALNCQGKGIYGDLKGRAKFAIEGIKASQSGIGKK